MKVDSGRGGRDGFTVLEVLVAQLILAFVLASTAALHLAAISQGAVSRRAVEAAALAQQELEQVRDMRYQDIASVAPTTRTIGDHVYVVARVVAENDPAANVKRIQVTVTWTIRGTRTYVAETIFTNLAQ